ncbi:MAG: hypothetical protein JNM63_06220, partial [Spirochaetia bacterium]|nr:hypothetical protein [Spirochaetia bacterium]
GLIEGRAEIYHDVYVKQEFVYYYGNQNQFLQFSFASNILDLKRNSANRIVHLGMRNAKDFMTLTLPSGSSTKFPDWEYRFVFYNHTKDPYTDSATNAFKLFAISLSYAGIETNGDFRFVEPPIIQKIEKEMHQIYGQPGAVNVMAMDAFTKLYFKSYIHEFNGSYLDPYNIRVQVNLSYTLFTGKLANLQLTYLTSDMTDQLLTRLSRVAYEESPRSGNPLPLK